MNKNDTLYEATHGIGCLGRSQPDEPVFVLVARDQIAAGIVREWAVRAYHEGTPKEKVEEAHRCADAMDAWREAHGGGKIPD